MKNFIIKKCINYIEKNTNYKKDKLKEIEYGLVSIYLTITKLIFISIVCLSIGIFKEMIIFTLFFNILRAPAFGLHATKSWICLIFSTLAFVGLPILAIICQFNLYTKICLCLINTILMFKNAPADTKKKPIVSKKRRLTYKLLSTTFVIIFSLIALTIKNNFISNCLILASILENCLISPLTYKLFKLPYNNYINFLKEHPEFSK